MLSVERTLGHYFEGETIPPYPDANGNLWLVGNGELKVSLFNGLIPPMGVITPQGKQLLKQYGSIRGSLQEIINGTLITDEEAFDNGCEGELTKIYGFGNHKGGEARPVAVKKRLYTEEEKCDCTVPPVAWESIPHTQKLGKIYEQAGYTLLQPYGADPENIYLPYVDGVQLAQFFAQHPTETIRDTAGMFCDDLEELQKQVIEESIRFMESKKRPVKHITKRENGTVLITPTEGAGVYPVMNIEVMPNNISYWWHDYRSFKNYLLLKEAEGKVLAEAEKGDVGATFAAIKSNLICIDPVFIRGCKKPIHEIDNPYEEKRVPIRK